MLVKAPHAAPSAAEPATAAVLQPLFAKLNVTPDPSAVPLATGPVSPSFSGMVDRFITRQASTPPSSHPTKIATEPPAEDSQPAPAEASSPLAATGVAANHKARGAAAMSSASSGHLWGRVAPCWRDLGGGVQVPVTFEVEFDRAGRLARAPKILRPDFASVSEGRLRAEGKALAALAACLPQADMQLAGSVQRLDFVTGG